VTPGSVVVPLYVWLTPALIALLLYGLGQGLVKKWIGEVPPARLCLYYVLATSIGPCVVHTKSWAGGKLRRSNPRRTWAKVRCRAGRARAVN
jgi:hypothetical protein